ncbi:actin-5-like [Asterias amurensis]|uniref:actin-5-like n=1 Tax=Asterias amurensis TaxID=7602 RepID=UPI003AB4B1AD
MNRTPTIVIDSGSFLTRVGLSGRDVPEDTFHTVVGRPKAGAGQDTIFVGGEAFENRATLSLSYPLDKYSITDMDDMNRIWEFCFVDVMGCDSIAEVPVMLTDGPVETEIKTKNRAKMAESIFETHNAPSFYVALQPHLALQSIEKTTGLVLDIGDSMVSSVPVVDGVVVTSGIVTMDGVAGRQMTDYLAKLLNEQDGVSITDRETISAIKEKHSYIAWDYEGEFNLSGCKAVDYTLPDGQVISLGTERFRCAEPLFRSSLLAGTETDKGVHKMAHESIQQCDESARGALYENIVLAGGSSCTSHLPQRLKKEIQALAGAETNVKVLTAPTRAWSAWLGGSFFASEENFPELAVSRKEYQEHGVDIINAKCTN